MTLPHDPIMLLSTVNMKLRDRYPTLDALCDDLEQNKETLCQALAAVNYFYDPATNQFI